MDEVLSAVGCILGTASEEVVAEKSRAIPGVTEVSPEPPPVSIDPPDAPLSSRSAVVSKLDGALSE